jgi:2-methylcitrate dehydratase PrpD
VPRSSEEAQFSVAWPVAVLISDGEVGPKQIIDRIHDPAVRDLAARVKVVESPEFTRLYHLAEADDAEGRSAAVVTLELRDGRRLVSETSNHVLYPEPPWGWEEVERKFHWLTRDVLDTTAAEGAVSLVRELSEEGDVGALVALLTDALSQKSCPSDRGA